MFSEETLIKQHKLNICSYSVRLVYWRPRLLTLAFCWISRGWDFIGISSNILFSIWMNLVKLQPVFYIHGGETDAELIITLRELPFGAWKDRETVFTHQ